LAPATYKYTLNGKPVLQRAVWTLALQKLPGGWPVAGWGWLPR
jgi:hypothetical protein